MVIPPPTHAPFTAKHPEYTLTPFPVKVEVPVPPTSNCPATERLWEGEVVPMPTLPILETMSEVEPVVEPTTKLGNPASAFTESAAYGVEVPTPILGCPPEVPMERIEEEPWRVEVAKLKALYKSLGMVVVADLKKTIVVEAMLCEEEPIYM